MVHGHRVHNLWDTGHTYTQDSPIPTHMLRFASLFSQQSRSRIRIREGEREKGHNGFLGGEMEMAIRRKWPAKFSFAPVCIYTCVLSALWWAVVWGWCMVFIFCMYTRLLCMGVNWVCMWLACMYLSHTHTHKFHLETFEWTAFFLRYFSFSVAGALNTPVCHFHSCVSCPEIRFHLLLPTPP